MDQRFSPPPADDPTGPHELGGAAAGLSLKDPRPAASRGTAPRSSPARGAEAPTLTSEAPIYHPEGMPRGDVVPPPVHAAAGDGAGRPEVAAAAASPEAPPPAADEAKPGPKTPKLRTKRRQRIRLRHLLPAWCVSLLVHVAILSILAAATVSNQDGLKKAISFDSALAGYRNGVQEELPILADPGLVPRDEAVGKEHGGAAPALELATDGGGEGDDGDGGGPVVAAAFGNGGPTATPRFRGSGKRGINESNSLPHLKIQGMSGSPLSTLPAVPSADLYGGGQIAGDPLFDVKEIGVALDQLAREILRHLKDHKLTVVWLFDESTSMQDDQRTILDKFDRVSSELKKNIEPGKKAAGALNHAIVGFGETLDVVLKKPTIDIDEITRAIKKLKTDMSGVENTMQAIRSTVESAAGMIGKDRKLLLVLVTDESGDDGPDVEEARQALKKYKVPLYVIGRQSLFGYPFAHHQYQDPITKDFYHPLIRRGPETADVEAYQWDGLYDRWDEQPSGFAPWELGRLARESGGIYFLLPSEEFMRVRQREKAYSIVQLKEYMPEYDSRMTYVQNRTKSELRRGLYQVISETRGFIYRREFSIDPAEQVKAAEEEGAKATAKLNSLLEIQKHLEALKKLRDREPERRWQAHYDLILAQTVAFQVKAFEYRALMAQLIQKPRVPSKQPNADLAITFVVDHAQKPLAPETMTAKKYAEATRLLKDVIARHPKTPWADLAQDTLDRGFSVHLNEWHHNPKYTERAQFVPKY